MVSVRAPFVTPIAFQVITDRFRQFCKERTLAIISSSTVRHWCWEWSAWRHHEDLNRYLTVLAWEASSVVCSYIVEFWAEADDSTSFGRRRASRLRFSERAATKAQFIAELDSAFAASWLRAEQLSRKDLSYSWEGKEVVRSGLPQPLRQEPRTRPRVLIVDDDEVVRTMLRAALEGGRRPIEVEEAEDGLEALSKTSVHRPDIVLMDLTLPGMSAVDLLKRLRDKSSLPSVPVIVLTAEDPSPTDREALEGQVDEFLVKPFNSTDLLAWVDRLLDKAGA